MKFQEQNEQIDDGVIEKFHLFIKENKDELDFLLDYLIPSFDMWAWEYSRAINKNDELKKKYLMEYRRQIIKWLPIREYNKQKNKKNATTD